jgi:hypothetical protein
MGHVDATSFFCVEVFLIAIIEENLQLPCYSPKIRLDTKNCCPLSVVATVRLGSSRATKVLFLTYLMALSIA